MAEHTASVTVNAPADQVFQLFSHFNDFPKFMSHVKEVTYYDDQRSHWVAEVVGRHEWDAVNENWIDGRQIGWRSTDGLENWGRVTFEPQGANQTRVHVVINYNPPAGVLGDIGEILGAGKRFEKKLQEDLNNFAAMVAAAPTGALDPTSSHYLFHEASAASRARATPAQDATMDDDEILAADVANRTATTAVKPSAVPVNKRGPAGSRRPLSCVHRRGSLIEQLVAGVAAARLVAGVADQALDLLDRDGEHAARRRKRRSPPSSVEPKSSTP
jgi:ribosome-associated toxin RatA of RatAB toxin-antitoxin module